MSPSAGPPSPARPEMARRQIDVEAVSSTVSRSRVGRVSGNRTSRRPRDTKPVVTPSTWDFILAVRLLGHLHSGHADGTYERWLLVRTRVGATNSMPRLPR